MTASEVRIGSLLYFKDHPTAFDPIVELLSLSSDHISDVKYTLKSSGKNAYGKVPFDKLSGIHLSELWLARLGFKKEPTMRETWLIYSVHIGGSNFITQKHRSEYYLATASDRLLGTGLTYVHELQNLFFAFTGQELEIK